ncbi:hypothetical protein GCM10020295_28300 [Streptomyces cinereospinus]
MHALIGTVVALLWLVWPELTAAPSGDRPAAAGSAPPAARQEVEQTPTADLVLPLVALVTAAVLAGYGYLRRTRRARDRTAPGPVPSAAPAVPRPVRNSTRGPGRCWSRPTSGCAPAARSSPAPRP